MYPKAKSFRRPFSTPREIKPTNELVFTQEFVDQQLGTMAAQEGELIKIDTASPQDTGSIPKIKPTLSPDRLADGRTFTI